MISVFLTTVQSYILRDYSNVKVGFNMINKYRTLTTVYSLLVKIGQVSIIIACPVKLFKKIDKP